MGWRWRWAIPTLMHTITIKAVRAGVTLSTHLGNALPQPQPKFLNPLMVQLASDELHASFIADGIHIPPDALKVLLRAKGPSRSILVTDATRRGRDRTRALSFRWDDDPTDR